MRQFDKMFLLLVLARNPFVFMKSVSYLILIRSFPAYIREHLSDIQEAVGFGLAGMPGGRMSGLPYTYAAAHFVARFELYTASRSFALHGGEGLQMWRKLFGPVTPGTHELHELAAVANKTTGYAASANWASALPGRDWKANCCSLDI